MTSRITQRTVTFTRSFRLAGMERDQPPGRYEVETETERLDTVTVAFRRLGTHIRLPTARGGTGSESVAIDPDELEAALLRDREAPPA